MYCIVNWDCTEPELKMIRQKIPGVPTQSKKGRIFQKVLALSVNSYYEKVYKILIKWDLAK